MTCVVGLSEGGVTYLAGDSACVDTEGDGITTQQEPKVFVCGDYVVGFSGSFAAGNLLRYSVKYPKDPTNHTLSQALKKGLETLAEPDNNWDSMIGYKGVLYVVQSDFHVYRPRKPYYTIGAEVAAAVSLGVMYTLHRERSNRGPRTKLKMALDASLMYSTAVRKPWQIVNTTPKG